MKLNGCWDYPPLEIFGNPVSRNHIIPLHGWALGNNPKVSIYVDDNLIDQIKCSSYREDIEIIFPYESKKMKNLCGWNYGLSTKNYSNNYHKITISISDTSGLLSLGERRIDFGKQNKPIELDNFLIDGYKKRNNQIYFDEADHQWLLSSSSSFGYSDHAKKIISKSKGLTLMVGSGFAGVHDHVVQLDIVDFPNIDVVSKNIPFKDNSFDNIFCENVIEHVPNPFKLVQDLIRVLKPNGYLGINGTNMHFTHGFPSHYFNPTEFGMRYLLDEYFSNGEYHFVNEADSLFTVLNYFFNSLPIEERQYIGEISINNFLNGLKIKDKNLLKSLSKMHSISKKSISTGIYFLGKKKKKNFLKKSSNNFLNGLKIKYKNLLKSLSKMHSISKKSISTGIYFLGKKKKKNFLKKSSKQ